MQDLCFRLGLGLYLVIAVVAPVRSADPPVVEPDAEAADDRSVTVERNGRKVTITEDESGITVTIVEAGTTTTIKADSALELRAKSRRAHVLYQRYLRRGRSRAEANNAGNAVGGAGGAAAAGGVAGDLPPEVGQVVGPGQIAGVNGLTAADLLRAANAMGVGNRLTMSNGFGMTKTSASGGTGSSVSFLDGGRSVTVSQGSSSGIRVEITEMGAMTVVTARTPEELAKKSPEAFRLYREAGKRARVSVGVGGTAKAGANGGGNSNATTNGQGFAGADGGGFAGGGGKANANGAAGKQALQQLLRNAKTERERRMLRQLLRQLGQ